MLGEGPTTSFGSGGVRREKFRPMESAFVGISNYTHLGTVVTAECLTGSQR